MKCTSVPKDGVRKLFMAILEILGDAQTELARKDKESENLAGQRKETYHSLCYWNARYKFDPFVEYVARILTELTTGWFWEIRDKSGFFKGSLHASGHLRYYRNLELGLSMDDLPKVDCGFADCYHREIMQKVEGFCDDIREFYDGTPLAVVWKEYDESIREAVGVYRKMVEGGEPYEYGLGTASSAEFMKPEKEEEKEGKDGMQESGRLPGVVRPG